MSIYVAKNLIKNLNNRNIDIKKAKVLILGFTFKENCPDIRNTKIIDIYNELSSQSIDVDVFDPLVNQNDAAKIYNLKLIDKPYENHYDAAIIAVGHDSFKELGFDGISKFLKNNNIIYDLKYVLDRNDSVIRL
jgi:UDP-N-acetyl-D-galactosamine dehydrogenase